MLTVLRLPHFRSYIAAAARMLLIATCLPLASIQAAQLTLQWTDNSNNEAGFRIERSTGNNTGFAVIATVDRNTTEYVDTTAALGQLYFYRVQAFNQTAPNDPSFYSNEASGTPKQSQTITFAALPGKIYGDIPFDVSPTATSGQTVSLVSSDTNLATVSGHTITIVGAGTVTITASQSGNASFSAAPDVSQTLTIAKAPLTVTADAKGRIYGAANPSFTATITGFVNGDTLGTSGITGTPALNTAATSASAVGNYPITAALGTLDAANYTFDTFSSGALTIDKAPLTVTADPKSRLYGAANPALTATITGFVNGETLGSSGVTGTPTLSTAATTASAVGTHSITAALGTLDAANYTFSTFTNGSLTITKAPLTVTADAKSRLYGAANPSLTATISGFVNGESLATSGITGAPTLNTTATSVSAVGAYPITVASGNLTAANYSFDTFTAGTLTVNKAPLTVIADSKSKVVGSPNPELTYTITGFANGETLATSDVTGIPAINTGATAGSPVGTYPITVTINTLASSNYTFGSFVDGVLTVNDAGAPEISSPTTASGNVGDPFSYTITATNSPVSFSATGLPAALSIDTSTGVISGTPDTIATTAIVLGATNASGTGIATLVLTIDGVPVAPTITSQPQPSQTVTAFTSVSLAVAASGTPAPSYQWKRNGVDVQGATAATLTFPSITTADSGTYTVVVSNGVAPDATSNDAVIIVNKATPTITTPPTATAITLGQQLSASSLSGGVASVSGSFAFNTPASVPSSAGISAVSVVFTPDDTANYNTVTLSVNVTVTALTPDPDPEPAIEITSASSARAVVGQTFSFTVQTSIPANQFSATNLPTGVTLNSSTGAISGVFTEVGQRVITLSASNGSSTGSAFLIVTVDSLPTITSQPTGGSFEVGDSVTLTVAGTGSPAPTYQWFKNGVALAGATGTSINLANLKVSDAGAYSVVLTNRAGSISSSSAAIGIVSEEKVSGDATIVQEDIVHPNGNVYDQVLLDGAEAVIKAAPLKITRVSFIDLNDDIVQVEFTGAGSVSLSLAGESGPALPVKYNQDVQYMKGHATLIVSGANESSHLSIFSVGSATAVDQSLFRGDVTYDGIADVAAVFISSTDGKFGGLRMGNASFFSDSGQTGIDASDVTFTGPVYIGDISALGSASPVLRLGSAEEVRITGGDLEQANDQPVQVSGLTQLHFTAGSTSHGVEQPAQANRGRLEQDGVDVTDEIVVNP